MEQLMPKIGAAAVSADEDTSSPAPNQPTLESAAPPSPLPPPRLIVDRAPDVPALISVDSTSMSVQWSPVSITVKSPELRAVECLEAYALEMQQVDVNQLTGQPEVRENRWSVQYSGPATYVQVKGLRPGRNYAVRVVCRPVITDPTVIVEAAQPSELLLVRTPATAPNAPPAPTLTVRQRNLLKFRWNEPIENGGHPILAYVVECHPSPEGRDQPPTSEGMYEIYRGLERSVTLKKLLPGVRYSIRVKAINCIGDSPFGPVVEATTQASVPFPPEPAVVASTHDSVTLRWAPVAGNGAEVTGYQVEMCDSLDQGEFAFVGHTRVAYSTIAGLRSGLTYRFRVRSENSEGQSQWSVPCQAVTAATSPSAPPPPTRSSATHSSIDLTWKTPENDGGSPITYFEVELQPNCPAALRGKSKEWTLVYKGSGMDCTVTALHPGCLYKVRVRAMNSCGAGAYSFPTDVATLSAVPEPPGPLSAKERMQTSISVEWKPPAHDGGSSILAYRLECRMLGYVEPRPDDCSSTPSGPQQPFQLAYDGAECYAELPDLEPGARYEVRVSASNRHGSSPWSSVTSLTTKAGTPDVPNPVEIVQGTTPRSLQLLWKRPYGNGSQVETFEVQMHCIEGSPSIVEPSEAIDEGANAHGRDEADPKQPAQEPAFTTIYRGSDPSCTVADLEPDTNYCFRIRALNSVGPSDWSEAHVARTAPDVPTEPQGFVCMSSSKDRLSLAWKPPTHDNGAPVFSYQVEIALVVRSQRAAPVWRSVFKGDALECSIDALRPGQEYQARVRAFNARGWSPWGNVLRAATDADVPDAPSGLTANARTSTGIRLTWAAPLETNGAIITEYELQISQMNDICGNYTTVWSGIDLSTKVSELSPGSRYAFRVRAHNAVGSGPWSPITVVTTSLAPPLPPNGLSATWNPIARAAIIAWEHPQQLPDHGACTGFEVEASAAAKQRNEKASGARSGDSKPSVVKQTCGGKAVQHRLTGFRGGTEWSIRMRSIGADGSGHGSWSATIVLDVPDDLENVNNKTPVGVIDAPLVPHGRRARSVTPDVETSSVASAGDVGDDGHGRQIPRAHVAGTRVVAAKSKPKPKTLFTLIARAAGLKESTLSMMFVIFVAAIILVAAAWIIAGQ